MTGLFLDTNVLLHYRRIDEIDWLSISGTDAVVLLICPIVVRELDHHKDSHLIVTVVRARTSVATWILQG
jgi:hypothetical protein